MTASPEFIALCQAQVSVLTQGLKADWTGVYLAEVLEGEAGAKLIPIAVHPQGGKAVLPEGEREGGSIPPLPVGTEGEAIDPLAVDWQEPPAQGRHQIVLPLVYQEGVVGLLVAGRRDRAWRPEELAQMEKIARTLAIARRLDRRQQWYQQQLGQQSARRQLERDRLDDLLHQLRNPLTALRTFGKLLLKRLLPDDPDRAAVRGMVREGERLQELLQVFEWELEAIPPEGEASCPEGLSLPAPPPFLLPAQTPSLEPMAVEEVLDPLLVSARAIAREKGIELTATLPPDLPPVRGNPHALEEVLNNLIDNALKYTPAGGQVRVTAGLEKVEAGRQWQGIEVGDTGCGIPPEDREQIFQRRYRGVQGQGEIPGTGLGLAIARDLVEEMQGQIELVAPEGVKPEAPLPGATFVVWLPAVSGAE